MHGLLLMSRMSPLALLGKLTLTHLSELSLYVSTSEKPSLTSSLSVGVVRRTTERFLMIRAKTSRRTEKIMFKLGSDIARMKPSYFWLNL